MLDAREVNGVTIVGPDLVARNGSGRASSSVASVFPKFRTIVTSGGIHAEQATLMAEHLQARGQAVDEEEVFLDAVPLLVRGPVVVIRSDPDDMARILAADQVLQRLLPKESIQFSGVHLPDVRQLLRLRGESWRIAPPPRTAQEVGRYIEVCRSRVGTGAVYYHNAHTGGRFITYQELTRIRPLIRADREEALGRLREVLQLTSMVNMEGAYELSFFLPADRRFCADGLAPVAEALARGGDDGAEEAERLLDAFCAELRRAAGEDLLVDGAEYVGWRKIMFCRLYNVHEKLLEEWALGLSREFHMNVRWLPGASIEGGRLVFEANAEGRVRGLIAEYAAKWKGLRFINVGRLEASQTTRDLGNEEREVFLVVLGRGDGAEDIRVTRMLKWDVIHRLKRGVPQSQAVGETIQYRDYIFDRLKATRALELPIPDYQEIRVNEEVPGLPPVPVFFIDRAYVPGLATDKLAPALYGRPGFMARLARLLGLAAAATVALGRADPRTGQVYFDDGDEVIQVDAAGLPERLVMSETTGSFTDWSSPAGRLLRSCLTRVAAHLAHARAAGLGQAELATCVEAFASGLVEDMARMQGLVRDPSRSLRGVFADRTGEPGGIRYRWEHLLRRLENASREELLDVVRRSEELAPYT
jgi:hypothetical protein